MSYSLRAGSGRNCPKHVEFYSKNKFEKKSASRWFYYKSLGVLYTIVSAARLLTSLLLLSLVLPKPIDVKKAIDHQNRRVGGGGGVIAGLQTPANRNLEQK